MTQSASADEGSPARLAQKTCGYVGESPHIGRDAVKIGSPDSVT